MEADQIILEGDALDYWKEKSELINMLTKHYIVEGKVILNKGDFILHFPEREWKFLRDLLTDQPFKIGSEFAKNTPYGYNKKTAMRVLDYLMVEDPMNFKSYGVQNSIQPRGQGPQKVRPIESIDYESNNSWYNNDNDDYEENDYILSKKNKYRSNVKINNNNNKKPWAKTRGYRYGRRSSNKTRRR